jgi:hypothetical protein
MITPSGCFDVGAGQVGIFHVQTQTSPTHLMQRPDRWIARQQAAAVTSGQDQDA